MSRTHSSHSELAKFKGRTGNGEDLTLEAPQTWPAQDPDREHLGFRLLHPRILWHSFRLFPSWGSMALNPRSGSAHMRTPCLPSLS